MGELDGAASASYLSGLLIGHELRSYDVRNVYLLGAPELVKLYARAAEALGIETHALEPTAGTRHFIGLALCFAQRRSHEAQRPAQVRRRAGARRALRHYRALAGNPDRQHAGRRVPGARRAGRDPAVREEVRREGDPRRDRHRVAGLRQDPRRARRAGIRRRRPAHAAGGDPRREGRVAREAHRARSAEPQAPVGQGPGR